jgi:signal transduction histidine kinase
LKPLVTAHAATSPSLGNDAEAKALILGWIATADVERLGDMTELQVGRTEESADEPVKWLDRDRLKILDYVALFPKGPVYEAFKAAEDVRQRYQLVGAKLNENILPTLVRASSIILVSSFLLLGSLFIIYASRFRSRVYEVIEGMSTWSEEDAAFRFDDVSGRYGGELRMITGQFNAMADEVEANRQRSLFLEKIASWQIIARKLAHEIKNPLTPIQMMVSQLKRRYKGDDAEFGKLLEEAQTIITEEVAGLRRMVDTFSNFARLPQPEPRQADVVSLARHAVELEKARFPDHELTFHSDSPRAEAYIDEDLVRQVLINLIKNAGEACGDQPSKIAVKVGGTASEIAITVTDNGPGIPSELLERIFEAYFTTKHTGPAPGMGLGLAVCRKIIMDHGGRIAVKSKPGETMFTIRLPRRKND